LSKAVKRVVGALFALLAAADLYLASGVFREGLEDVRSELRREKGNRFGDSIGLFTLYELAKTARDVFVIYPFNRVKDLIAPEGREELAIFIDKETHAAFVVDEKGGLVLAAPVATGQADGDVKTRFGEYITPAGEYVIIRRYSPEELRRKFGGKAHFYGGGMIQLLGPWAPHIAIHGTDEPGSVGKGNSNGCIRMRDEDFGALAGKAKIGSRVFVRGSTPLRDPEKEAMFQALAGKAREPQAGTRPRIHR